MFVTVFCENQAHRFPVLNAAVLEVKCDYQIKFGKPSLRDS